MDLVMKGLDWAVEALRTITDPRWLQSNTGWAALLGLGLLLIVGWLCLFKGKRRI